MAFQLTPTLKQLSKTPSVLEQLLADIPTEWIRQNEGPNTWSPYNIVGHLIHGEKTDWVPRARIILFQEDKNFIPYDRTAQERLNQEVPIASLLEEFAMLRKENLIEVRKWNLSKDQLKQTGVHPAFGVVTLQALIATWLVHDYSHIHQLTRVLGKNFKLEVGPWNNYIKMIQ